jgi:hypothetical protein
MAETRTAARMALGGAMAPKWRVWGEVRTAAPDFAVELLVLVPEAGRRCGEARGRSATLRAGPDGW